MSIRAKLRNGFLAGLENTATPSARLALPFEASIRERSLFNRVFLPARGASRNEHDES